MGICEARVAEGSAYNGDGAVAAAPLHYLASIITLSMSRAFCCYTLILLLLRLRSGGIRLEHAYLWLVVTC
jgi:hypothetical protein